jgi:hypothetical protein
MSEHETSYFLAFLYRLGLHWKADLHSGYKPWKIDNHGLISESKGHFDSAGYERQLKYGMK